MSHRNKIAVDWSQRVGVHITRDGETVERFGNLDFALDSLDGPNGLYLEKTYESYNPAARAAFEARCAAEGHVIHQIDPRNTELYRRAHGIVKTDANDCLVLWKLMEKGAHFRIGRVVTSDEDRERAAEFAKAHMLLRRTGQRDAYAAEKIAALPAFGTLEEVIRTALHPGKKDYNPVIVATVALAKKYTRNRSEFESLVGLHGSGRRSQARSDLLHWGWKRFDTRAAAKGNHPHAGKVTLSEFRRAVRWLYHNLP